MANVFGRRFDELCEQAESIDSKKKMESSTYGIGGYHVDPNDLLNWVVKARHLITSVCGPDSEHYKLFIKNEQPSGFTTNYNVFQKLRAVLLAAKDDYEGGYLNKLRNLIQAEVFDNELEQAAELLASSYMIAAAVVAGVVLEAGLRQMCEDNGIVPGKLDKMNADLAKAGIYSKLVQKQITALADIRNSAAHGKPDEFSKDDVANMIRDVPRILSS